MKLHRFIFSPLYLSLIFLALAWTLPFLQWHHQPPIPSFYTEGLAFGLGLLALLPLLVKRYWQPLVLPRRTRPLRLTKRPPKLW